ncbi:hypothetical protein [Roseinatronobacter sp. S2]|uniref:hypothetical protein n=1 Tax=Roseinatronobacter sp. S2 TaxID=3035471 RepID=UPI002410B38F|nr:hypothetical protein [Roseinatronobacter sp. S2]WFE75335.1 hypothetical protein P8S53_02730 [Roseinatronobacter sp. S2]
MARIGKACGCGLIGTAIAVYEAAAKLEEPRASVMLMRIVRSEDSPFHDPDRACP